jgi:hypothetical protein
LKETTNDILQQADLRQRKSCRSNFHIKAAAGCSTYSICTAGCTRYTDSVIVGYGRNLP